MKFQKELVTFRPCIINGKILVCTNKRVYYSEQQYAKAVNNKSYYFNEQFAKDAIKPYIQESINKFEKCKDLFFSLQKEQNIDISYIIEGDTQGIEDYMEISFNINGFSFSYRI